MPTDLRNRITHVMMRLVGISQGGEYIPGKYRPEKSRDRQQDHRAYANQGECPHQRWDGSDGTCDQKCQGGAPIHTQFEQAF